MRPRQIMRGATRDYNPREKFNTGRHREASALCGLFIFSRCHPATSLFSLPLLPWGIVYS